MRGRGEVRSIRCYSEIADQIQEESDQLNHRRMSGPVYTTADGLLSIVRKGEAAQDRVRFLEGDVARLMRERNEFEREVKRLRKSVTV